MSPSEKTRAMQQVRVLELAREFRLTTAAVRRDLKLLRTTRVFDDTLLVLLERTHQLSAGLAFSYLTMLLEALRGEP